MGSLKQTNLVSQQLGWNRTRYAANTRQMHVGLLLTPLLCDIAHRDKVATNWIASPILAESLEGLAPAHVVTAEFDGSRDESEIYAVKLQRAGVPTTMKRYMGVPHAFGHYNVSMHRSFPLSSATSKLLCSNLEVSPLLASNKGFEKEP